MKLSQLPDGESIFLDANILLYSAFDHPAFGGACRDFKTTRYGGWQPPNWNMTSPDEGTSIELSPDEDPVE